MNQPPSQSSPSGERSLHYLPLANQGPDSTYRAAPHHHGYPTEQMQSYAPRPVGMIPGAYPPMYPSYEDQMRAQAMMRQQSHMQHMHQLPHPSMRAQIPVIMPHPSQMYTVAPQADLRTNRLPQYEIAQQEAEPSSDDASEGSIDSKTKQPSSFTDPFAMNTSNSADEPTKNPIRIKPRPTAFRDSDDLAPHGTTNDEDDEDYDGTAVVAPGTEQTGRWTKEEHDRFLDGLRKHGKEWKKVAAHVNTRTVVQTRTHAQKYFQKLHKSGGIEEVEMGIDTTNVSSNNTRRSASKRRKSPSDFYEKRRRADTEDSDDYVPAHDEPLSHTVPSFAPPAMSITVPDPTVLFEVPQPSPATCGKRKDAELMAIEVLASAATQDDKEAGQLLSLMKTGAFEAAEPTRKRRVGLSIINPDQLASSYGNGTAPETPWYGEVRALEARKFQHEMSVSTPSERKECISKMRNLIVSGAVQELELLMQAASAVDKPHEDIADLAESDDFEASSVADGTEPKDAVEHRDDQTEITSETTQKDEKPNQISPTVLTQMLNKRTSDGSTMLMLACDLDPSIFSETEVILPICTLLTAHGASVAGTDKQGRTCLHRACSHGMISVMRLLIRKGCSVNVTDAQGNTALHIAAAKGFSEAMQLLVDSCVNCHVRNKEAKCALDVVYDAVRSGVSREQQADLRRHLLLLEPRLRTLILYHPECLEHTPRRNTEWEGPERLQGVINRLQNYGAFKNYEIEISHQFERASVELLNRVHSSEYISFVSELSRQLKDNEEGANPISFTPKVQRLLLRQNTAEVKSEEHGDTSFSVGSLNAARRAAGAVADAVDKVLLGRYRNAFCLVRPPGHHAGYRGLLDDAKSCGFCIFNNVAAGALHALEVHRVERVAIIDFDIHHGNGTEDIVRTYPQPHRLFFFSIHLMDKEPLYEFFPGSGATNDTAHNIINVPIAPLWREEPHGTRRSGNAPACGRDAFRQGILQRLLPTLRAFNPQLILLSAGFDAAAGDVGNAKHFKQHSTAGMDLHPEDFEWVTAKILEVADICCNGRVISVLEGGYGTWQTHSRSARATGKLAPSQEETLDRSVLAECVTSHIRRLIDPYGIQTPVPQSSTKTEDNGA